MTLPPEPPTTSGINWAAALAALAEQDPDEDEAGNLVRTVFLGTLQVMSPSGKYYQPFACSNLEPCDVCQGTGDLPNPDQDDVVFAAATVADHDLTVAIIEAYGPFGAGGWPPWAKDTLDHVRALRWKTQREVPCERCGGCGSPEAHHDAVWWECLEDEAEAQAVDPPVLVCCHGTDVFLEQIVVYAEDRDDITG